MYKKRIFCITLVVLIMLTFMPHYGVNVAQADTAQEIEYVYPDFPVGLSGTVYYVDWDAGNDNNTGTSPDTPFKNAPGNGSGIAKATVLQPGDKVIFKGGVAHGAKVVVSNSGTPEMPIVYDGNTEGTFGEGRTI